MKVKEYNELVILVCLVHVGREEAIRCLQKVYSVLFSPQGSQGKDVKVMVVHSINDNNTGKEHRAMKDTNVCNQRKMMEIVRVND